MEKAPLKRKIITTQPKKNMPKRFMKNMQKNMNKNAKNLP
jgi:hypothetical protein